ncbi:MAG: hypothetical protein PHC62_06840 [Candidatus Izemoplasmatales bacterium]|nr:hypothetical protein [Candidatus Izemoplasmatales bacterium]
MRLIRKYRDYEEGITVYQTENGMYEVLKNDDGDYFVTSTKKNNKKVKLDIRNSSVEFCEKIIDSLEG